MEYIFFEATRLNTLDALILIGSAFLLAVVFKYLTGLDQ
jgi:hypothetical protein